MRCGSGPVGLGWVGSGWAGGFVGSGWVGLGGPGRRWRKEEVVEAYRRWRKAEWEEEKEAAEEEERSRPNTGPIPYYRSKLHEKQK